MTDEERRSLQRLHDAMGVFKGVSAQMPVGQAMALMLVALHEGKSLRELAELADTKMPTMSRQLIDLGLRNRRMEPGYMLVEQKQNPLSMRENQYFMSLKGKHLLKDVFKALNRADHNRGK
jgi:DNA-binding MarR family transcriptional regulator